MKKYKIIYADPPWRYARSKVQGAAEKHYPTMSIEELCALPVKEIADKDCILFLWATFPQLKEALQLIKAWGFTYKSVAFVWLKQNRKSPTWFYGLGFWTRGNAEICLLATKGHPKRQSNKVHQFIISPVEQHSKKPDETRDRIVQLIITCEESRGATEDEVIATQQRLRVVRRHVMGEVAVNMMIIFKKIFSLRHRGKHRDEQEAK